MEEEEREMRPGRTARAIHGLGLCLVLIPILFLALLAVFPILQPSKADGGPDMLLTDADVSFSRMDAIADEALTAYARVRNTGGSEGTATVRFYIDLVGPPGDMNLSGEMNIVVPSGGSSVASLPIELSAGSHSVSASVTNVTPEDADLTNNFASTTIEVFPSEDLVVFSSPTLLLEGINANIQGGTERVVPLNITALGGQAQEVTVVALESSGVFLQPVSPITLDEGQTDNVYVRISVPELEEGAGSHTKELLIQAVGSNAKGNSATIVLFVHPPVSSTTWWNSATATLAAVGVLAAVLAAINSVEWGKYKFLGVFLPLYTKLKKEDILNQYTRGKIHGYLLANPGDYFNSIAKALDISSGNLAYHLRVLEREGEIVSKKDGVHKRFYPRGVKIGTSTENELSEVQRSIYKVIKETPGIKQKDIASLLGVASSTVNYHIQKLIVSGLVLARRKGMAMQYRVVAEKVDSGR
jgi:predicted transcriptional regulator